MWGDSCGGNKNKYIFFNLFVKTLILNTGPIGFRKIEDDFFQV